MKKGARWNAVLKKTLPVAKKKKKKEKKSHLLLKGFVGYENMFFFLERAIMYEALALLWP